MLKERRGTKQDLKIYKFIIPSFASTATKTECTWQTKNIRIQANTVRTACPVSPPPRGSASDITRGKVSRPPEFQVNRKHHLSAGASRAAINVATKAQTSITNLPSPGQHHEAREYCLSSPLSSVCSSVSPLPFLQGL